MLGRAPPETSCRVRLSTQVCGFSLRKYPVIQTDDDRERYKAVFQDQFSEYKELSAEVQAILRKFDELDTVMSRLPHHSENHQVSVHSCREEEWSQDSPRPVSAL